MKVSIVSLVISSFFFDTFSTGIIIRRTIVDSSIFTLIVIISNTLEHYFRIGYPIGYIYRIY